MIDNWYNEKFRKFFDRFSNNYFKLKTDEEKKYLFDLAVDFVERNRDFVMQYPIVQYWEKYNNQINKKELIWNYSQKNINLYFHIPFCSIKCSYCNFHIVSWEKLRNLYEKKYILKLLSEIDEFLNFNNDFIIDTIFIWWWTPSYLSDENLELLLNGINNKLSSFFSKNIEFTFEWNPESLDLKKFQILINYWINRVSIGVQSFNESLLKNINRIYNKDIIESCLYNADKVWFKNINIDMMYWLPGSNYEIMKSDLLKVVSLNVEHITYYPLYYYDWSILSSAWKKENNIKQIYDFYDEICNTLLNNWFKQYWREYFCRNDKIHNYQNNYVSNSLLYWFWHSAYSFNDKYAFYKEQNLINYINSNNIINSYYSYNNEDIDRRLFVLWSRNINISKVNIKNIEKIEKTIKLAKDLDLVIEEKDYFSLTNKWIKYQELFSHLFV